MKLLLQKTIILVGIFFYSSIAKAQIDAARFIRTGKEEANKLFGAYLQPVSQGLASGVNDAWYSTAKPLGLGGFDIKFGFGASMVNNESKSFTLASIGANTDPKSTFLISPIGGNINTKQPTIVGDGMSSRFAISTINPLDSTQRFFVDTISPFEGTGSILSLGTTPFLQLSVGLIKGTEIMIRLLPIQNGDFKSSGFGFGIKHSLSQWIWGVEKLPIDISGIFSFNTNNLELSFGNNFLDANSSLPGGLPSSTYKNSQKLTISNVGYQYGLVVSKKLSIFTPYLGVTYNSASSEIAMKGIYPVQSIRVTNNAPEEYTENITDPIKIPSKIADSYRASLGFRLKFGPIAWGVEYNHSFSEKQFNTFNATLAINIQQLAPIFKL